MRARLVAACVLVASSAGAQPSPAPPDAGPAGESEIDSAPPEDDAEPRKPAGSRAVDDPSDEGAPGDAGGSPVEREPAKPGSSVVSPRPAGATGKAPSPNGPAAPAPRTGDAAERPTARARPRREEADAPHWGRDASSPRYPGYVVAGIITLSAGTAAAIGSVATAFGADRNASLGLGVLAATAWGTGLPLTLLGSTPVRPGDSELAYAGIALGTAGVIGFGLGGTLWARREADANATEEERAEAIAAGREPRRPPPDPDYIAPTVIMVAGGAATIAGVVAWAIGADVDEDDDREAKLVVGPASVRLRGRF